jgi:hypothetical protein
LKKYRVIAVLYFAPEAFAFWISNKKLCTDKGEKYIKGTDPKDPNNQKIFSASIVKGKNETLGYIYVILGSKKSESIIDLLYGSKL